MVHVAHLYWLWVNCRIWIEWIDSKSNPADLNRRGLLDEWACSQGWHLSSECQRAPWEGDTNAPDRLLKDIGLREVGTLDYVCIVRKSDMFQVWHTGSLQEGLSMEEQKVNTSKTRWQERQGRQTQQFLATPNQIWMHSALWSAIGWHSENQCSRHVLVAPTRPLTPPMVKRAVFLVPLRWNYLLKTKRIFAQVSSRGVRAQWIRLP